MSSLKTQPNQRSLKEKNENDLLNYRGQSNYPSTMDMSGGYMDGWSDDDPSEVQQFSKSKRHKMEPEFSSSGQTMVTEYNDDSGDPRQWTQQHLNAADIRNPDILACALTPPQVGRTLCNL